MPAIRPTRGVLLALFIVSVLIVALIRAAQGLVAFDDWGALIVGGLAILPFLYLALRIRTLLGKVLGLIWLGFAIYLALLSWHQLQVYGVLTGLAFIGFITGPIVTLPPLAASLILATPPLREKVGRGLLMAAGAAAGAAALVIVLRSLQHLDPVWDTTTVGLFAGLNALGAFVTGVGVFDPRRLFAGEPGLPRATAMGILGFLLGGLLVVVVRGLQSIDPIWDPGVGMTAIAFITTGFFVWGMGAFNPQMSAHGEHHAEAAPEEEAPIQVLGTYIWQVTFLALAVLLVIAAVALWPGGPGLIITSDPTASTFMIGSFTVQLPGGGPAIQVSELVVFIGFAIFTVFSLGVFGGGLALLFYYLNKNITEVRKTQPTEEELTPPEFVQSLGRTAEGVSNALRRGLPRLLGQK